MSNNTTVNVSSGLNLGGALLILFIALKLTNVIDWSWWWVTCPAWLPFMIALTVAVLAFFVYMIVVLIGLFKKK